MSTELFKIRGIDRHMQRLERLPAAGSYKVTRKAGRKAMKPVEKMQKTMARKNLGDLELAIGIRTKKGKVGDTAVTISAGPIRTSAKGRKLKNINQKAIAQEYGNAITKAFPFIRPSLENNIGVVVKKLGEELGKEIDKAFK